MAKVKLSLANLNTLSHIIVYYLERIKTATANKLYINYDEINYGKIELINFRKLFGFYRLFK
jgi:hypothetical protein